nr:CRISPR-associated RAMP protein [bacterium]
MIGFASFQNRTIIEGKVKLLTALHIGRGQSLEPVGTDNPVVKDLVGKPFIPGSSFKGILRSTAERLAATLYRGASNIIEPCFITDENGKCISCEEEFKVEKDNLERFKNRKPDPPTTKEIAEWFWDKLCPVCRLFGSPHFSSKIAIKDLTVDETNGFAHFEIRDGVAIDRGTETTSEGKLYDFEVVPAGVEFDLNIVLDNADEKDLGLLYLALSDFERGNVFIGGSKTKGLGNVELRYTKIEEIDEDNLVNHLLYGKGRIYESMDEEPAELKDAESEDVEKKEKETAKEPAPSFPQLEMPEAINTP